MKNLRKLFAASFGIALDQAIPLVEDLVPIEGTAANALLFGSPIAAHKQYLIQSDLDSFVSSCPQGYFLVGFGGHGINSSAFYYSRVDAWSRILFRLPYGGVYADNDAMAKHIVGFLNQYFDFEKKLEGTVRTFVAVESMHKGYYKLEMPDGQVFELKKSLLATADFELEFALFLAEAEDS